MVDLSVVIVNWNVRELLKECLASLVEAKEVIVVDNASTDGSGQMVRELFPHVKLISNQSNTGFPRANNQGIRASQGRYVLLLNPDTQVLNDALSAMVTHMDAYPRVGVLGPQLLNSDGTVQSSRRRFPTLATAFVESTILQRYLPHSSLLQRYYCEDIPPNTIQEVDWVTGACMTVRRETIDEVGLLDEDYFMYSEELDWCFRIKKAGWKIVYLPSARVVHHYGQSSEKDLPHRHIYFQDSKCKFFAKHYGILSGGLLRLFILATYVFQVGEEGIKFLLGHKRRLRRERLQLLLRVIKSGLRG